MTSNQFRNQGGGIDHTRLVTNSERRSQQHDLNTILSAFSSKQDTLNLYVQNHLQVLHSSTSENLSYGWKGLFGTLKKEKLKIKYRIYEAIRYRKLQRFYAGIVNDINGLCRKHDTWVRIYYGGANINSSMKGMRGGGVPTKKMRNLMATHFDTYVVDEHYTSQVCDLCFGRLQKCMNKSFKVNGIRREIRGTRRCEACAKKGEPRHNKSRDGNAAMNMIIVGINSVNDNFERGRFDAPQEGYRLTFYPSNARTNGEENEQIYTDMMNINN